MLYEEICYIAVVDVNIYFQIESSQATAETDTVTELIEFMRRIGAKLSFSLLDGGGD